MWGCGLCFSRLPSSYLKGLINRRAGRNCQCAHCISRSCSQVQLQLPQGSQIDGEHNISPSHKGTRKLFGGRNVWLPPEYSSLPRIRGVTVNCCPQGGSKQSRGRTIEVVRGGRGRVGCKEGRTGNGGTNSRGRRSSRGRERKK